MGKFGIALLALLVGLAAGAFGGITLGGGAMVGAGASTGMLTGFCATAKAGQDLGYLTPAQADEVLRKAATIASGKPGVPAEAAAGGMDKACTDALGRLQAASGK